MSSLTRRRQSHGDPVLAVAADILRNSPDVARAMARHLHDEVPEFQNGDPEQFEETCASCEASIAQAMRLLKRQAPPNALVVPPEVCDFVNGMVRRGIPLAVGLRCCRLAHRWFWEIWSQRQARALEGDPRAIAELERISSFMFDYVDLMAEAMAEQYGREHARLRRSAASIRADTVHAILTGEPIDEEVASRRLGYELRRHNLGLRVTGENGAAGDVCGIERAAQEAAGTLGCGHPLVVAAGAAVLCVWCGSQESPSPQRLGALEAYVPPESIRVTAGRPGFGSEGFRRSHDEAAEAARVASIAGAAARRVVCYPDVELVSLLASDFERARRFVASELGALGAADEATRRLRETVLSFLDAKGSNVRAARRLHVHQNTVIYRINRTEELLGHPVTQRSAELTCALRLAATLGDAVLTASEC